MVARTEPFPDSRNASENGSPSAGPGSGDAQSACSFAGFRLQSDGTLWRGDAVVHLPPKELAALRLLIACAGQIVSPVQLKHALWDDVHVTADSVPKCLSSLRARLEPESCIQTVYKRGYRFTAEIGRPDAGSTGAPLRLAILPFTTRSFVPDHLGAAIAEEIIARLGSGVPNHRLSLLAGSRPHAAVVIMARDSVFNLALSELTAQQIGQKLNADLVLTGTVQAFSAHYRLRAEMIRVEDGTQIWVEDIMAPQNGTEELESELLRRLDFRLGGSALGDRSSSPGWTGGIPAKRRLPARPSHDSLSIAQDGLGIAAAGEAEETAGTRRTEAYEIFLRGHHEWQTLHRHRMQDGQQHLLRAIELDPDLICAKVDLAHLCVIQSFYGFMSPAVSADLVHRVAESISDLSRQAEALLPALGWISFHFDRNLHDALLAFSYSSHLPHDPWTTRARTMFALSRHRFADAIAQLRAAIQSDPFSPWLQNRLAWALHLNGQAEASVEQIRRSIALFPQHEGTGLYGAAILAYNGEAEPAIALAQELAQRLPFFDLASSVLAYALACAGRGDEARAILERLQWLGRERFVVRGFTPAAYAALGDHQAALAELRADNEARCPWFFQMLADPRLKPLHGNPEFQQMRKMLTEMEAEVEENLEVRE